MALLTAQELGSVQQTYPGKEESDFYIYGLTYPFSGTWQDDSDRAVFLKQDARSRYLTYCVTLEGFSPDFIHIFDLKLLQQPAKAL